MKLRKVFSLSMEPVDEFCIYRHIRILVCLGIVKIFAFCVIEKLSVDAFRRPVPFALSSMTSENV